VPLRPLRLCGEFFCRSASLDTRATLVRVALHFLPSEASHYLKPPTDSVPGRASLDVRCGKIRSLMERAGDILGKVARRLGRPEAALAWLQSSWPTVVGRTIAAHTRPVRCENARLELTVDAEVWLQQLETMHDEICARINRAWGATLIREVKFVSKPGPRKLSRETDNEHTPFIRRRP